MPGSLDPIDQPQGHELVTPSKGKAIAKRKATPKQSSRDNTGDKLSQIVRESSQQVDQYSGDVREAIQGFAEHQAEEFVSAVAEMPTMFFDAVSRKLEEVEVDRDSFREASESVKRIFAIPSKQP